MAEASRDDLLEAAGGKFDAFRSAVDAIGPDAFRLARYLGRNEAPLELCQNWLVAIFDELPSYDGTTSPRVWLVRRLLNLGARFRAQRSREAPYDPKRTRRHRVDDELLNRVETLNASYRDAFLLHFGLEWSVEDTATALEVAPDRCRELLARARYFVTQRLRHFFLKPTSGSIPADTGASRPEACRALLGHFARHFDGDPSEALPEALAAHLESCGNCKVEAELYRRIPLRPASTVAPDAAVLWTSLMRYRAMMRAHQVLEASQAGLMEAMIRKQAPPRPSRWTRVVPALLLLVLLAAAVWYATTQAGP